MDTGTLVLLEMLLVLGLVLGLAVFELVSLRRDQRRRAQSGDQERG